MWRHRHGDIETRRRGDMETWRLGDVETWRRGDVETWRRGDMEKSRHGHGDIKQKMEAQAIFLHLFTVCLSCKQNFVVCTFVD
jgi:hypothetical protein